MMEQIAVKGLNIRICVIMNANQYEHGISVSVPGDHARPGTVTSTNLSSPVTLVDAFWSVVVN